MAVDATMTALLRRTRPDHNNSVPRRSDGTRQSFRPAQAWPKGKPFRILAIDGGGICGLLPALVLAEVEGRYLNDRPIGAYFDLITGTSTGGIIALGLAQGMSAHEIASLYLERGRFIFPGRNKVVRWVRRMWQWAFYAYSRNALENELKTKFGQARFGSSRVPVCIPAFEGHHGEPYIFKTPHHPDYKLDRHESLVDVGLSTAAAPTFFAGLERNGYTFVDGGIWANNPVMIGLVDALTCFDVSRRQIHILSLGCGQSPVRLGFWQRIGGKLIWSLAFYRSAMKAQSHNALGQAGLLVGRDHLLRIDAPESMRPIDMDDVPRACAELPRTSRTLVDQLGDEVARLIGIGAAVSTHSNRDEKAAP